MTISRPSNVAQLGGRPSEVWGAQRQCDHVFAVRSESPVARSQPGR